VDDAKPQGAPEDCSVVPAGRMPPWDVGELPRAPRISWSPRGLIGPGLMMVGAAIGGGEWTMGPAVTGQYGGIVMWLALVSILFQVAYNLEIMRYTVYCGEPIILVTSQISQADGIIRRWTDLLWTGNPRLKHLEGNKVKYVYYGLLVGYAAWGLLVLVLLPSAVTLTKFTGGLMNLALGFSSFHTLAVNLRLLPRDLRPGWILRLGLVGCGVFFIIIAILGLHRTVTDLGWM
jgi:hypothetical protein